MLNKEQEAKKCLADFAAKIAEKKQTLSDVIDSDKKIAIFEITGKELYLYGKSYGRSEAILYDELGLHAPEKVEKAGSRRAGQEFHFRTDIRFPDFQKVTHKNNSKIDSNSNSMPMQFDRFQHFDVM